MGKTKKGGRHAKIIKKAKQAKRRRKMKEASLRGETAEFSPEPEHARRMVRRVPPVGKEGAPEVG